MLYITGHERRYAVACPCLGRHAGRVGLLLGRRHLSRIASCASTGTIAGLTDFRLGVWNPVAGAYLAQTANEAANVVANSLMTFDLLKPVVAVAGQPLLLTIGGLGTTLPIIRGAIMGAAQAGRLLLAGYRSCTLATGWTGGDLPRPGMGSTGGIPWIELM